MQVEAALEGRSVHQSEEEVEEEEEGPRKIKSTPTLEVSAGDEEISRYVCKSCLNPSVTVPFATLKPQMKF